MGLAGENLEKESLVHHTVDLFNKISSSDGSWVPCGLTLLYAFGFGGLARTLLNLHDLLFKKVGVFRSITCVFSVSHKLLLTLQNDTIKRTFRQQS